MRTFRVKQEGVKYNVTIYSSGFLDWGVCLERVDDDGFIHTLMNHPCYLDHLTYGTHPNGRPWGDRPWREVARELVSDLVEDP